MRNPNIASGLTMRGQAEADARVVNLVSGYAGLGIARLYMEVR